MLYANTDNRKVYMKEKKFEKDEADQRHEIISHLNFTTARQFFERGDTILVLFPYATEYNEVRLTVNAGTMSKEAISAWFNIHDPEYILNNYGPKTTFEIIIDKFFSRQWLFKFYQFHKLKKYDIS